MPLLYKIRSSRNTWMGGVPFGMALSLASHATEKVAAPYDQIGLTTAYELGLTGRGVDVAVVDEGFDPTHPVFADQAVIPLVNRFQEENGDVVAIDAAQPFVRRTENGEALLSEHGVAVSSLIVGKDWEGGGGVAKGARLFQIPVLLGTDGGAHELDDVENDLTGALAALRQDAPNARIVNFSFGVDGEDDSRKLDLSYESVQGDLNEKELLEHVEDDRLLIFAGGNESQPQPGLFSALPRYLPELEKGFLNVVALDKSGRLAGYSNQCGISKSWCLAAPGDVPVAYSEFNENGEINHGVYDDPRGGGTSYAAPIVSASAALLAERFPYMSMEQVRMTMLTTATDLGDAERYGWGMLNVAKAIDGPGQLLGDQRVVMDGARGGWNARDFWRNDIVAGGLLTKVGSGHLGLLGSNRFSGVQVEQGELLLAGRNTFSDPSRVEGGRLQVQGSLEGPGLQVARAGTLAGAGQVSASTRIEGTLEAGASGGPVFTRDLLLADTSTTRIDINHGGAVRLDGKQAVAQLGGTVHVTSSGARPLADRQWLLEAVDGATYRGGFQALRQAAGLNDQGLRHDLRFGDQGVALAVASVGLPNQENLRGNARATAQALNALRDRPIALRAGAYNDWLHTSLEQGNLGGLGQSAGGQVYADGMSYLSRQPAELERTLFDELGEPLRTQGHKLWYRGVALEQYNGKRQGISASREDTNGWAWGTTNALGETTQMGVALARTEGKVNSASGKLELDVKQLGVGVHHGFDSLVSGAYVSASITAGHVASSGTRRQPGFGKAKGEGNGQLYSAAVRSGYRWAVEDWRIEPHVGVSAVQARMGSVHERQSELSLEVKSQRQNSLFGNTGIRASRPVQLGEWYLEPQLELTHTRALAGRSGQSTALLDGVRLEQRSAYAARDNLATGLSLAATRGAFKGSLEVRDGKGDRTSSNGANLTLSYSF
ncbi:S8 family serine peptidase [Pseudomonas putida]|nr:S8 family serine peptidase [Pseudomonas putida]